MKVLIVGRRRPGMTLAEHRHHIRHVHGEIVLGYIAAEPDLAPQRYVQNSVVDGQCRPTPSSDPLSLGCDFVTQVWFPSLEMLGRSRSSPYYLQHVKDDEANFADVATATPLPAQERVVSAGNASGAGWKLFGFLNRANGVAPDAFVAAWSAAAGAMSALAGAVSVRRHVQNDVIAPPGAPAIADAVDEFWLPDEGGARTLLAAWQSNLEQHLVRPGLAVQGSSVAVIAREDILHAGA
jgi:hypothetical protein